MKPDRIQICIANFDYGLLDHSGNLVSTKLKPATQQAYAAAESAAVGLVFIEPGVYDITEVKYCPADWSQNQVDFNNWGIHQNNAPAMLVGAFYPDGRTRGAVIKADLLGDTKWNEKSIQNLLITLYKDEDQGNPNILCKYLPILCKIPAIIWLGVLSFASYETYSASTNKRLLPAAGVAVSLYMFNKAGGIKAIKPKK